MGLSPPTTPRATTRPVASPGPGWVVAKSLDRAAMTARAVLTYPVVDQQGDFVAPDGGDWDTLRGRLAVNWWHEFPVGRGSVELKSLTHDGKTWDVPVGTTRFFRNESDTAGLDLSVYEMAGGGRRRVGAMAPREAVAAARDVFRLVADGEATGVSIEFNPDPQATTVTKAGRRFDRWLGRGWAHTPRPVNEWAQLLLPDEPGDVNAAIHKAMKQAMALGMGAYAKALKDKSVCPLLLKSLARKLPTPTTQVTVPRTVRKAMEDELMPDDAMPPEVPADPPAPEPAPEAAPADETPPEISESYDAAQMVADLAQRLKDRAGKSLHAKTRKQFAKAAEKLEMLAEDLIAHGEGTEAELDGMPEPAGEEGPDDAPADDPAADESDAPADGPPADDDGPEAKALPRKLERNADGTVVLKSRYRHAPRRLKLSELGEPTKKAAATEADRRARARLEARLDEIDRGRRR